jgi:hypothetical protein
MYMPSKIFRHVFASPQPKIPPPPLAPSSLPLSFPLRVHLTVDQINGLLSREYVLDVKLGHNAKWIDLEHTNVAGSKFIVDPRVQAKVDSDPSSSFAKEFAKPCLREVSTPASISSP